MNNLTVMSNEPYCDYPNRKSIGKRLRDARVSAGFSRDDAVLLEGINVSRTTLQQWETGAREASIETIIGLAIAYKVDPKWIFFKEEPQKNSSDDDYSQIPFYKAQASAGHGSFLGEHREPTHHLAFRKRWITAKGFSLKDLVGLVVKGDSMEPSIKDGAAIIINTSNNEAQDGNIYVIRVADRLWVKRTQWLLGGGLRLNSDNTFYEAMDLGVEDMKSSDIEVIGQVVHTAYDLG